MNLGQYTALNGWPLFYLITALSLVVMVTGVALHGVSTPAGMEHLVRLAGQVTAPSIFLVFAASPVAKLFPGSASQWLLRNRRYIGLSFAAAFAWHLLILVIFFASQQDYYLREVHTASDLWLGAGSYIVLVAMATTSFFAVRRRMRPKYWRALHLVGIWYFWAAMWATFVEKTLRDRASVASIAYSILGFLVLALRIVAYQKTRADKSLQKTTGRDQRHGSGKYQEHVQ
jgi:sulfoxide reductase heme-binding subunit YedZ